MTGNVVCDKCQFTIHPSVCYTKHQTHAAVTTYIAPISLADASEVRTFFHQLLGGKGSSSPIRGQENDNLSFHVEIVSCLLRNYVADTVSNNFCWFWCLIKKSKYRFLWWRSLEDLFLRAPVQLSTQVFTWQALEQVQAHLKGPHWSTNTIHQSKSPTFLSVECVKIHFNFMVTRFRDYFSVATLSVMLVF